MITKLNHRFLQPATLSLSLVVLTICGGCTLLRQTDSDNQLVAPIGSKDISGAPEVTERELCLTTAVTLAKQGHAAEAIQLYEKAESLSPDGATMDLELAPLYAQIGDNENSIARYRNAIANGNANEEVLNNFAWTLAESGKLDEASAVLKRGLASMPDSERLNALQAVLLYRQGHRELAMQGFANVYGESAAYHNMAVLDLQYGNIDSAIENANKAIEDSQCDRKAIEFRDALVANKTIPQQ